MAGVLRSSVLVVPPLLAHSLPKHSQCTRGIQRPTATTRSFSSHTFASKKSFRILICSPQTNLEKKERKVGFLRRLSEGERTENKVSFICNNNIKKNYCPLKVLFFFFFTFFLLFFFKKKGRKCRCAFLSDGLHEAAREMLKPPAEERPKSCGGTSLTDVPRVHRE